MVESFGPVAIFFIVAAIFPAVPLVLSYFIHPKRPNPVKLEPYESGVETIGPTHVQFRTRYYLYALIFVIFDVEVMYLFPWGVAFGQLGIASLIKMLVFIAFLLVGLAYAWRKGALTWE
ncbi:MAG: NADH-quinone oxidoreductase subunit A [Chloroflexi bacterium]|nr:NADH-quinone oxidoreductase subunit A [Chloroflexota bacterium]